MAQSPEYEVVVVGGGPAGLTAALFAARQGRSTILLDPLCMGGAILNTERIEDFPGFPDGVAGFDLGPRLQEQAAAAGATVEPAEVTRIERHSDNWRVATDAREIGADAVIVATGSRPRKLGLPREDELEGKGLSHCASCDGPLFRGKAVAMVGGRAITEASGRVTPQTAPAIAASGVDLISVGWLTHSAPVLDIGLDFRG